MKTITNFRIKFSADLQYSKDYGFEVVRAQSERCRCKRIYCLSQNVSRKCSPSVYRNIYNLASPIHNIIAIIPRKS